jgi:ABC-type glutathione transport system ATPase component
MLQACDRVLVMEHGRLVRDMPAQVLLESLRQRAAADASAAPKSTPPAAANP